MRTDSPLLIGHRGVPSTTVENTMPSFAAALDAGLDGVEIDVHRTRDGVLAVHHDPVTTTGLELATVDWPDLSFAHPEIPRVEDVFELMEAHADRYLNVELKSRFPLADGREEALAAALGAWRHRAAERAWISCFDPLALARLRHLGVEAPLALLAWHEDALELPELVPALDVAGVHVEQRLATGDRIERWHADGRFVFAWTVNEADAARALAKRGIDGIIGDFPGRLHHARS